MATSPPTNVVIFGPNGNCTLDICPIEWSIYQYRPSLAANSTFIALYAIALLLHIYLGVIWRSYWFMSFMVLGCVYIIIGYVGRIMMYFNPFMFSAFILQIICVSSGPVFFTAAIYITLSKVIERLGADISRIRPKLYYWIFISADVICLILQAAGGAMSTISSGVSQVGVDLAMAGLILQVIMMAAFSGLLGDYLIRFIRHNPHTAFDLRIRMFFGFLSAAVVLILGRCCFRCYELSEGYRDSDLITDEGLFIGLEGVLITLSVFALCIGHPGLLLNRHASSNNGNQMLASVEEQELADMNRPSTK